MLGHEFGTSAVSLAAGYSDACAIMQDDTLDCTSDWLEDNPLAGSPHRLALGIRVACVIDSEGVLACWGDDAPIATATGRFVDVAVGESDDVCAVESTGDVRCWSNDGEVAIEIQDAEVLRAGSRFCALADGRMQCWFMTSRRAYREEGLEALQLADATDIDVGSGVACALDGGRVRCAFLEEEGYQGLPGLSGALAGGDFASVTVGSYQLCGLRTSGEVDCVEVCQVDRHGSTCG